MAEVATSSSLPSASTLKMAPTPSVPIPQTRGSRLAPQASSLSKGQRSGHLNLNTFSPVNQNGSFEFDRVLMSGTVQKRTRKTKAWKPVYLVLRPNLLSIYKDDEESKLRHQINLSDLTAIAALKDKKQKRQHVFGLFSPSRNYHMEAPSAAEMRRWVDLIRREARIDEDEHEMSLRSPGGQNGSNYRGFERGVMNYHRWNTEDRLGSSSPEPIEQMAPRTSTTIDGVRIPPPPPSSSHIYDYSGNEMASYSDLSDSQGLSTSFNPRNSSLSLPRPDLESLSAAAVSSSAGADPATHAITTSTPLSTLPERPAAKRSASHTSIAAQPASATEQERVVHQGHLLCLKTIRGIRQWRRAWVVLRPRQLALYKDEGEYAARLILPLSAIIDAVETDPISRSKRYCLQIIVEDKRYRFCAAGEEDLANWLGALKSLLVKRRERAAG